MGYQESYITTKKQTDFDMLVKCVKSKGKQYYDDIYIMPVEIITFNKNHCNFKRGDKAIYVVGERYYQSHFFDKTVEGVSVVCNIYFTEDVDPVGVWKDATPNEDLIVEHRPFIFD